MVVTIQKSALSINLNGKTFASREEVDAYIASLEAEAEAQLASQKPAFKSATITFESEAVLHDMLAAWGAYHDRKPRVCDSGTAPKFGLTEYTGNARATVRRELPGILKSLGIEADTTVLGG